MLPLVLQRQRSADRRYVTSDLERKLTVRDDYRPGREEGDEVPRVDQHDPLTGRLNVKRHTALGEHTQFLSRTARRSGRDVPVVVDEERLAVGGDCAVLLVVLDVSQGVVEDGERSGSVNVDSDIETASARVRSGAGPLPNAERFRGSLSNLRPD
jgi:hypothetical protein